MNMTNISKFIRATLLLLFKLKYETFNNRFSKIIKLVYDLILEDHFKLTINEDINNYTLNEKLIEEPIKKYEKIKLYGYTLFILCNKYLYLCIWSS